MKKITKDEVLFYVLEQIQDPNRRNEIEEARQNDPQVADWFDLMDPSAPEDMEPEVEADPLSPEGLQVMKELFEMPAPAKTPVTSVTRVKGFLISDHENAKSSFAEMGLEHQTDSSVPAEKFAGVRKTLDEQSVEASFPNKNFDPNGYIFPYHCVLLGCLSKDGVILGTTFLALAFNEAKTCYENEVPLQEIEGGENSETLGYFPIDSPESVFAFFSKPEALKRIQQLLETDYVQCQGLEEPLNRLIDDINNHSSDS